jgi:hypothetical protein
MSAIKNMSLFVPHIFPNFDQKYVTEVFSEIGEIERVDFVSKLDRDGKPFNAAYIHFKKWYNNENNQDFQYNIIENGSGKWYHDDSDYYWIVLPNTAKKHVSGDRKPRIDLGESKSITYKTPEKPMLNQVCPDAPKKLILKREEHAVRAMPNYAKKLAFHEDDDIIHRNLDAEFEEFDPEASEEAAQMAEIEEELEKEDQYLVSIDSRYVQVIEQENMMLHGEIAQLRMALINLDHMYQAEVAKVRAFSSNVDNSIDL